MAGYLDIAKIANENTKANREEIWSNWYQNKWRQQPNVILQSAYEEFLKSKNYTEIMHHIKGSYNFKLLVDQSGKQVARMGLKTGFNRLVAQEIVAASVGGVKSEIGRRSAVFMIEETGRLAAARGANVAVTGVKVIASLPVGVTAAVGELTGNAVVWAAGIENHHAKNTCGAVGSISGGATAGMVVGGPIGALAGAGVGIGSWGIGQGIKAVMRIGSGPGNNGCTISIGDIGREKLCVGTYASDDTLYWITHSKQYNGSNQNWDMSAGQGNRRSFQLCIWGKNGVIKHFNEVFYRDTIGIIKQNSKYTVVHCKGQYHTIATVTGTVDVFQNL